MSKLNNRSTNDKRIIFEQEIRFFYSRLSAPICMGRTGMSEFVGQYFLICISR